MWRLTFTDRLSAIKTSRMEAVDTSDGMSDAPKDKAAERWKQIEQFLEHHDIIQNADVRQLCGVSPATADRIFAKRGRRERGACED